MTKYLRPLVIALALLALGASIAALYVHYRIIKDPTYTSFCDISETVSCEAVLESPYATVGGVPVAAGGVIWSALVLLIAAGGMRRGNPDAYAAAAGYVFVLATIGLSAVLYLGYASFFIIGKMCPLCMTMYMSVIGVFLVTGGISMSLSALPSRLARDLKSVATTPVPAALALIFLVGSVSLVAFFPRVAEQVVADSGAVFTPPTETIEPDQLAEFNKWIDAQPRVTLPISNDGASGAHRQVQRLPVSAVRPDVAEVQADPREVRKRVSGQGEVRHEGLSARSRMQPLRPAVPTWRRVRRQRRSGWPRQGEGAEMEELAVRQPADDDADASQGGRAPGRAGHGLRRPVLARCCSR